MRSFILLAYLRERRSQREIVQRGGKHALRPHPVEIASLSYLNMHRYHSRYIDTFNLSWALRSRHLSTPLACRRMERALGKVIFAFSAFYLLRKERETAFYSESIHLQKKIDELPLKKMSISTLFFVHMCTWRSTT